MALVQAVENGKITESTTETTTSAGNDLGYDEFLQLLCAEMQYQDPLEPTSNTEYVAQLATFSQMESMLNMQNSNLCHALFSRFDLRRKIIVMCRGSRSLFFQNRILQQVIL